MQKTIPTLSIIIVNWNTAQLLIECVASIKSQTTNLDYEIIVIDNASQDDSVSRLRAGFPGVQIICNTENKGFAAANNQGFKVAKGEILLMLNSDTLVRGNVLAASTKYLSEQQDIGVLGCRIVNPDGSWQRSVSYFPNFWNLLLQFLGISKLRPIAKLDPYRTDETMWMKGRDAQVISGCCMFVRRKVYETIGGLDESFFFFGEETDWCSRILKHKWRIRYEPISEVMHYGSASARKLNHKRDLLLTNAVVRLNMKHGNYFYAILVYFLLFIFNFSRAIYWGLAMLISSGSQAKKRFQHFRNVCLDFTQGWPKRA